GKLIIPINLIKMVFYGIDYDYEEILKISLNFTTTFLQEIYKRKYKQETGEEFPCGTDKVEEDIRQRTKKFKWKNVKNFFKNICERKNLDSNDVTEICKLLIYAKFNHVMEQEFEREKCDYNRILKIRNNSYHSQDRLEIENDLKWLVKFWKQCLTDDCVQSCERIILPLHNIYDQKSEAAKAQNIYEKLKSFLIKNGKQLYKHMFRLMCRVCFDDIFHEINSEKREKIEKHLKMFRYMKENRSTFFDNFDYISMLNKIEPLNRLLLIRMFEWRFEIETKKQWKRISKEEVGKQLDERLKIYEQNIAKANQKSELFLSDIEREKLKKGDLHEMDILLIGKLLRFAYFDVSDDMKAQLQNENKQVRQIQSVRTRCAHNYKLEGAEQAKADLSFVVNFFMNHVKPFLNDQNVDLFQENLVILCENFKEIYFCLPFVYDSKIINLRKEDIPTFENLIILLIRYFDYVESKFQHDHVSHDFSEILYELAKKWKIIQNEATNEFYKKIKTKKGYLDKDSYIDDEVVKLGREKINLDVELLDFGIKSNRNKILGIDRSEVEIDNIHEIFSSHGCHQLIGKPKIFIFNTCSSMRDSDENYDCSSVDLSEYSSKGKRQMQADMKQYKEKKRECSTRNTCLSSIDVFTCHFRQHLPYFESESSTKSKDDQFKYDPTLSNDHYISLILPFCETLEKYANQLDFVSIFQLFMAQNKKMNPKDFVFPYFNHIAEIRLAGVSKLLYFNPSLAHCYF
ncbi:hypothetical protein B4U79_19097, partial [Dinothrombium tinctorium]